MGPKTTKQEVELQEDELEAEYNRQAEEDRRRDEEEQYEEEQRLLDEEEERRFRDA